MKLCNHSRLIGNTTYTVRFAQDVDDVLAAQALRFNVFNLELGEGLETSWFHQRDADQFDGACDHLLIEYTPTGKLVGTCRLQTGEMAAKQLGYYSAQEFEFKPFEGLRAELVELGRICIDHQHRSFIVFTLLWRGIADYARIRGARYLCGCSSLFSQDSAIGAAVYAQLKRDYLIELQWRTMPLSNFQFPLIDTPTHTLSIPKLLSAYLGIGAKICGPPAFDWAFGTIDFLTFLELAEMTSRVKNRFLA